MAASPEPLRVWSTVVPPEWIDYNGHLTEGYYGVAFGQASDEVLVNLGFGPGYLEEHGSFYTVESRIRYLREVKEGVAIRADSWVLSADAKRIHLHHELFAADAPAPVATQESMMLHVTRGPDGPRVAPMVEPVLGNALAQAAHHATVPLPDHVGRGVRTLR